MKTIRRFTNLKTERLRKNKISWVIVAILILAAGLRLWNLNNVPPHLTPDEAALGYNAYSILKTGRDEHGKFMPLIFQSFGDYKPGLYVYTTVPFVAILGLNEWSVRLPSALCGVLIVYLVYLIANLLFDKKFSIYHLSFSIFAAFTAATNPWLIYFSRGAWEANLSLMLTLFGIYFFLKSLHTTYYILHSAVFFGLTLIAYQGAKLSTLIVLVLLIGIYWNEFWQINKKYLINAAVIGFVFSLPAILSFRGQTGRLSVFSIFNASRPDTYLNQMLVENNEVKGDLNYYLFHSDTYDTLRGILGRYFNHFSGRFLFFEGDWPNLRHSAPYQGQLLLSDLVTLLIGLAVIFKSLANHKSLRFILVWLLLSPLPAVLTRDQVHAVRALNMSIPLVIISGLGLGYLIKNYSKFKFIFLSFFFLAFVYFVDSYFIHVPAHNSKLWDYGYKQIVETVAPIKDNYKKVLIQQSFAQPYIYFLFFEKYDPSLWQKQNNYIKSEFKGDVGYVTKLDNVIFGPIDWSINRGDKGTLIVGDPVRIPVEDTKDENEFRIVKEIYYLNNRDLAFRIIEIK